ncbi:hypothetical protein ASG94_13005 [Nocardioides sp. Soil805]|nr:hypothetical protein ASG94_13005 [Nocardioides sp. Soil805]
MVRDEDGTSTVLVDGQVIALSEVAAAILEATPLDGAVSLEQLTDAVVASVGRPPAPLEALDVVQHQVHDLVAHRLLVTDEATAGAPVTAASVAALRSCLRHVMSPSPDRWSLPDGVSGTQLLAASERHRVTPTLARSSDRLALPAASAAGLAAVDRQQSATVDLLAHDLARVLDRLDHAGIRCICFKGLPLAVQAHGDVAARGTGDLDLLVPPADLERAHRVLVAAGWSPAGGYPSPGSSWAWRHFVRTNNELALVSPTSMVDLHWHLGPARSAFPDFDTLWARRAWVDVLGREVPTLSPYDALAHSASHAAKDGWHWMRGIVDVHRLIADPRTWDGVDRPLHQDQLLTVGLAVRMLGMPRHAPPVLAEAAEQAARVWDATMRRQATGAATHQPTRVPGLALVRGVRALRWAGASRADLWHHLSHSALPEWLTYQEASPHAAVVVPRVLGRRATAFLQRARAARAGEPSDGHSPPRDPRDTAARLS